MGIRKGGLGLLVAALHDRVACQLNSRRDPAAGASAKPTPGAMSVEEGTTVAQGWALLAQGLVDEAAARAAKALAASPRSPSALVLAVEVAVARGGSQAGLSQYERWLGQRTLEEPAVLRRIAQALLARGRRAVREHHAPASRRLRALAAEGDAAAAAELATLAAKGRDSRAPCAGVDRRRTGGQRPRRRLEEWHRKCMTIIEALAAERQQGGDRSPDRASRNIPRRKSAARRLKDWGSSALSSY